MDDFAVRVENLGKLYRIGAQQERYRTLRESLVGAVTGHLRRLRNPRTEIRNPKSDTIWALKYVSFEVKPGEVVGIIGRNGAGKSTLLKVLSHITEPTEGRVTLRGPVGSLLEVGTGFHPELTGRENIYLNGAILGMKKAEIERKFDEIVAFAEIDKFLDTPVKHYSSGMYVRLAFAVAAYLEPEILLVDEVLAVGDAEFQKKCLGKMGDISHTGRTVLFVSHNLAAIQQLCQKGIVLENGHITFYGGAQSAISHYVQSARLLQEIDLNSRPDRKGVQLLKFTRVRICDASGNELNQILSGQDIRFKFDYSSKISGKAKILIAFNVRSSQGYLLTHLSSQDTGKDVFDLYEKGYFECVWPKVNLRAGSYDCNLFCSINGEISDWVQSAFTINVEDGDYYDTGKLVTRQAGDILVSHSWSSSIVPTPPKQ